MSDPVTCRLCGFTCKNRLEAYSPIGGGTWFVDVDIPLDHDKDKIEEQPICTDCLAICAQVFVVCQHMKEPKKLGKCGGCGRVGVINDLGECYWCYSNKYVNHVILGKGLVSVGRRW